MKARFGGTDLIALVFFFVASASLAFAEANSKPLSYGLSRTIHSKVLNEDRTVSIRLPEDYEKSDKNYPVLYKLDGEGIVFVQASSTVSYLVDMTDKAPDHIVVGIGNTDRTRDMSPEQGADNFILFLKTELIPFIDSNYRTNGFKLLCGQSLSSIFALYSFLKQPELFDGYILSSFGLYKDSLASLFQSELKKSDLKKLGKKYLFITNGKMDTYDPDGSVARRGMTFLDSLKQTTPATVLVNYRVYDDEGHVPFPSIYDGLKWIYSHEILRGPYLGQKTPSDTPAVFAPDVVSNHDVHSRLAISPDGKEMCWTSLTVMSAEGNATILCVADVNGQWTRPKAPSFVTDGMAANPLFSPDGTKLFFIFSQYKEKGWSTRYVQKTPSGWSAPKTDGFTLNPTSSFTKSGEVYFSDQMTGKPWNSGIYRAEYSANGYLNANALDATINSPYLDYSPYISPDGSYLMWSSSRPSTDENMFLYISFRDTNGKWSAPRKMNDAMNFSSNARFPSISPDGKYLFFCGDDGNIYWVNIAIVEKLRMP